jgi:exonuclease III
MLSLDMIQFFDNTTTIEEDSDNLTYYNLPALDKAQNCIRSRIFSGRPGQDIKRLHPLLGQGANNTVNRLPCLANRASLNPPLSLPAQVWLILYLLLAFHRKSRAVSDPSVPGHARVAGGGPPHGQLGLGPGPAHAAPPGPVDDFPMEDLPPEDPPPPEPPPPEPPPEPPPSEGSHSTSSVKPETKPICLATWNIQSGCASHLEMACRALQKANVDACFLTEAKLTDGIHTHFSSGYHVFATRAHAHFQGGIALVYWDSEYWQIESEQCHGPNVISAYLVTGYRRIPLVRAYIPPGDDSTMEHVERALTRFANGPAPLLLGDLNCNLEDPQSPRDIQVAAMVANHGIFDMLPHFKQRKGLGHCRTWRQLHNDGNWIASWCDYFLGSDRCMFCNVCLHNPRHFTSDHLMVVGVIPSKPISENKAYLQGRQRFPLKAPKWGPAIKADHMFSLL